MLNFPELGFSFSKWIQWSGGGGSEFEQKQRI